MRCANRNKQPFWYALYKGKQPSYDINENEKGWDVTYANPVKTSGNISAAKGEVVARQFGDDDMYDRVIVVEDRDTPIDENTVIWIDTEPALDENGALTADDDGNYESPWNYIVRKVARGLPTFGGTSIAVSKVTVR